MAQHLHVDDAHQVLAQALAREAAVAQAALEARHLRDDDAVLLLRRMTGQRGGQRAGGRVVEPPSGAGYAHASGECPRARRTTRARQRAGSPVPTPRRPRTCFDLLSPMLLMRSKKSLDRCAPAAMVDGRGARAGQERARGAVPGTGRGSGALRGGRRRGASRRRRRRRPCGLASGQQRARTVCVATADERAAAIRTRARRQQASWGALLRRVAQGAAESARRGGGRHKRADPPTARGAAAASPPPPGCPHP